MQSPFPLMLRAEGEPAETCSSEKRPWAVKTPTKARKGLLLKGKVTKPRTSDVHGLLWGQQWPLNAPTGNLAAVMLKPFARQHGNTLDSSRQVCAVSLFKGQKPTRHARVMTDATDQSTPRQCIQNHEKTETLFQCRVLYPAEHPSGVKGA